MTSEPVGATQTTRKRSRKEETDPDDESSGTEQPAKRLKTHTAFEAYVVRVFAALILRLETLEQTVSTLESRVEDAISAFTPEIGAMAATQTLEKAMTKKTAVAKS
jgi:hypothetical protein